VPAGVTRAGMLILTAAVVLGAACSVPVEEAARVQADGEVPFGLLDEEALALVQPPSEATADVELCFVAGRSLAPVAQPLEASSGPLEVARALAVPPPEPAGLTTALTDGSLVTGVDVRGGVARVDLAPPVATVGSDAQLLLVAQLVCTLTALPGVGQVTFLLDGTPVQVPTADGSLAPGPVARDDYSAMIA
jgi:hypothetical protein